jgi:aryl-alcohol dehydrogenase-like predicted oxidoreductase|tara:strand:+ start:118 stop:1005 length:888 start_codon:yes stop_codon:yes gene_type:complete
MVGTVQFGMTYGIANQQGRPSRKEVLEIIKFGYESGICDYDTAAVYGESEEVLGQCFKDLGICNKVNVFTKIKALDNQAKKSEKNYKNEIVASLDRSLKRLKMDCVAGVLFHREEDVQHLVLLQMQKQAGKCHTVGVSCGHEPEKVTDFLNTDSIEALQLPFNLMDHRHSEAGVLEKVHKNGVLSFIRSAFLQGILTMKNDEIPTALANLCSLHLRYTSLAEEAGITLKEMALRFILNHSVSKVVIGIESLMQFKENLCFFERGPLPDDLMQAITLTYEQPDPYLITPGLWPLQA